MTITADVCRNFFAHDESRRRLEQGGSYWEGWLYSADSAWATDVDDYCEYVFVVLFKRRLKEDGCCWKRTATRGTNKGKQDISQIACPGRTRLLQHRPRRPTRRPRPYSRLPHLLPL